MPEIYRRLHLIKLASPTQIGFSMAAKRPIEFDMEMSATTCQPTALNGPSPHKNCDFLHSFYNFYV
jgi:hypothetical protein